MEQIHRHAFAGNAAMCYGIRHEQYANESHCKLNGTEITVEPCELFVDPGSDGIFFEAFQNNAYYKGCLEAVSNCVQTEIKMVDLVFLVV